MIVLDTHVLVWLMFGAPALGASANAAVDAALIRGEVHVSAISFWEATMLILRSRLELYEEAETWRQRVLRLGVVEIPVFGDIAIAAAQLPDFHGDPADRLITATAVMNGATLVTADRQILKWRSTLPRLDARR